jgi:RNA polymerase sigma-70 factor (sigma-E family)
MNNNQAASYVPASGGVALFSYPPRRASGPGPRSGYILRATYGAHGCLIGMANLRAGPEAGDDAATDVSGLFRARYAEMVRLADLLGADDPEDIAQEAFARLIRKHSSLRDPDAALAYVRAIVCNLTRNRHRHLRVVRLRTPAGHDEASSEQAVILREDQREVLTALAGLPPRRREAIVLRYWLDLSEREIAQAMGISPGTVKSNVSRGLAALAAALGEKA